MSTALPASTSTRSESNAHSDSVTPNEPTIHQRKPSSSSSSSHPSRERKHLLQDAAILIGCTVGIYSCFLGYGFIQERIYSRTYGDGEKFRFSLFLVFMQCIGNCFFAVCCQLPAYLSSTIPTSRVPAYRYMGISFSYVGAMFLSNVALSYMSYPAQALAKSIKLIPVMLMRIVVLRHKYSLREYAQVALITIGIAVFMSANGSSSHGSGKSEKATSWIGLLLCVASLILDGYTSPTQEHINKHFKPTMFQMQFWLNLYAILMVGLALIFKGEMADALHFVSKYPSLIYESMVFGLLSALGQAIILFTILRFNSLVVVTITTTRKFFTILFSVVWYGHVLNVMEWSGVALVFVGLGLDIYHKYTERGAAHKALHNKVA